MPVDRARLQEAMLDPDPETTYFVDSRTGKVVRVTLKDPQGLARFKAELTTEPRRFVQVPRPSGREKYAELSEFIASVADSAFKKRLQAVLASPNPYRELNLALEQRFKEQRQWKEFRRRQAARRMADFLKLSGLN
jgi:hypothetical protein